MPERRGRAETNPNTLSIFAFKPRQVILAEQHSKNSTKHNPMAKNQAENKAELKPDQKSLILHSMALWLENFGFSKTLKRFLSEGQIKDDDWRAKALDLKDMFSKYLETCGVKSLKEPSYVDPVLSHTKEQEFSAIVVPIINEVHTNVDPQKDQELTADSIVGKNGRNNSAASEENVGKKEKSKNKDNDSAVVDSGKPSEEVQPHDKVTESNAKLKKEKHKKTPDALVQSDHELLVSKQVTDGAVRETPVDELDMKEKEKKKRKSKLSSESLNGDENQVETIPPVTEEKSKDLNDRKDDSVPPVESKSKDKKKKKKLKVGFLEDGEEGSLRNKSEVEEANKVVSKTELEERKVQDKEKKRKKDAKVKSSSSDAEVLDKKDSEKSGKKLDETVEDGANGNKTAPKKRKRVDHDEEGEEPVDESAVEESKHRKTDGQDETNGVEWQANDSLNNNGVEKNNQPKSSRKQRNGSAEPKTLNAFQRVKVDEVKFVDERLQDNSYWAKDGADTGYGAKAQEVLGQVRGRDFRHEKTKKKRGSYRGGLIDLQSHSIKFNYSDEE